MSGGQEPCIESWREISRLRDREITANERFWLDVIRIASRDADPAPTLETVQKLRLIFQSGR
jgi:hypothetical protein